MEREKKRKGKRRKCKRARKGRERERRKEERKGGKEGRKGDGWNVQLMCPVLGQVLAAPLRSVATADSN